MTSGSEQNDLSNIQLSEIIPLMEEVHRGNGHFVPNIGIPSAFKQKEEIVVERMMEHCGFKTAMACVLGRWHILLYVLLLTVTQDERQYFHEFIMRK